MRHYGEPVPQATLEVLGFPLRTHVLGFFAAGEMSPHRKIAARPGSAGCERRWAWLHFRPALRQSAILRFSTV